jgi:hypothetical protein
MRLPCVVFHLCRKDKSTIRKNAFAQGNSTGSSGMPIQPAR